MPFRHINGRDVYTDDGIAREGISSRVLQQREGVMSERVEELETEIERLRAENYMLLAQSNHDRRKLLAIMSAVNQLIAVVEGA